MYTRLLLSPCCQHCQEGGGGGVHLKVPFLPQLCQNVPAAGNFVALSQFLAAYSTLDFTMSPLAGKGTWCLLPTTPAMLPTATKHFDRAGYLYSVYSQSMSRVTV